MTASILGTNRSHDRGVDLILDYYKHEFESGTASNKVTRTKEIEVGGISNIIDLT